MSNYNLPSIRVSVSPSGGLQSGSPVTFKNQVLRLESLADVEEISPANGATLVYRSQDDKYVVQMIDVDGGVF